MRLPALLALLALAPVVHAADFQVAPAGSDAAGDGSAAKPFATLDRALAAARADGSPAGDTLVLHGGEFRIEKPVTLVPADSGAPGKPLRIEAAPGEKPVLTSAAPVSGWKLADAATPGLAKEAVGKVFVADLAKGRRPHFLYADGKAMPVASACKDDNWKTWPRPAAVGDLGKDGQTITLRKEEIENLPDNGDVEMDLMPVQYWNSLSVLRGIDRAKNTVQRHSKNPTTFWRNRFSHDAGRYNLRNALKFLTRPGEWCVDSSAGKLYFWPADGAPEKHAIRVPTAYRLLELQGDEPHGKLVHDVIIKGLTLACTDRLPEDKWPDAWTKRNAELPDAMLFLDGVEDCTVEDCALLDSGAYGIAAQNHAQRLRIVKNEIARPGCGGVLLQGHGPGGRDVNKGNTVTRNWIHDTGVGGYLHAAAITMHQSGGNDISLNRLDRLAYAGIVITGCAWNEYGTGKPLGAWDAYGESEAMYHTVWDGIPGGKTAKFSRKEFKKFLFGQNNRIHDNILTNYMTHMGDGGALYSWGSGLGNSWEGNLLQRGATHAGEQWAFALYLDDYVDGFTVKNNLCWHDSRDRSNTINKGANTWEANVVSREKPADFDARFRSLVDEGEKAGGWLNCPEVGFRSAE